MWFIEVIVADPTYHRGEALTYSTTNHVDIGQVVIVPLQHKHVLGIISRLVSKPRFAVKEIILLPPLPPLPRPLQDLLTWMRQYYPAPTGLTAQLLLPGALPKKAVQPLVIETSPSLALPPLTPEQDMALKTIESPGLHILHGETGSGKTRVYLELAKRTLLDNRSSIILTPEIGLTSQLAQSFRSTFGDRVVVLHSGLGDAKRRQLWQQILTANGPLIIIGARSALFAPLHSVGLIVVDEEHEPAYKQDQAPYYHTTSVAAKLASLHKAILVLGSATPLVSDFYIATAKNRPIIRMTHLAAGASAEATTIHIVDLKDRSQFARSTHLSTVLIKAIEDTLQRHEQVLLFLNRRGTARVVFCDRCTWQATCPHCDLPLVYHGDQHIMRCHSCSYKNSVPTSCPECQNTAIVFRSIGTKAITAEVERLFPEARIMRFDTDNRQSERLETHYESVRAGKVDIIVGTQTLAKGLDLPKLGLVGVIIADTSLYFPDFSAQERTYQLLTQVLGRIGRGHRQGSAVVQTYTPDSPLLKAIVAKDWTAFYTAELGERQQFLFPPFCYLLKITCKRASSQSAQKAAEQFASTLRNNGGGIIVEGPTPSFHERTDNKFVWQLIIKAKSRDRLTTIINQLPSGWSYDIDPMNLL